jgi:serine/threonine protein kinase
VNIHNNIRSPIIYYKDEKRTRDLIPAQKEWIGRGSSSKVYLLRDCSSKVVKKIWPTSAFKISTSYGVMNEFNLGVRLSHRHLVKYHLLFIKKNTHMERKVGDLYKLVMDKIEGKILRDFQRSPISNETVVKLLSQAQNCCLYLYGQKVAWADVNPGNIYILQDNKELMLADFEFWATIENRKERALQLLLGSMELVGNMIKSSSRKDDDKKYLILFPKDFFGEQIKLNRIASHDLKKYENDKWMKNMKTKIAAMETDEEILSVLKEYFNHVIDAFNQA